MRTAIYYRETFKKNQLNDRIFLESSYSMLAIDDIAYSKLINTFYGKEISIFITNHSNKEIKYLFQYSADNINFIDDGYERTLRVGETINIVPTYLSKVGRIRIKAIKTQRITIIINEEI